MADVQDGPVRRQFDALDVVLAWAMLSASAPARQERLGSSSSHPNSPCTNHFGRIVSWPIGPRDRARSAGLRNPRRGNSRAWARPHAPPGRGDALRPFNSSDIMQDLPPTEARGGPLGTSATASIGSGRAKRRNGRAGRLLPLPRAPPYEAAPALIGGLQCNR